MDHEVVVIGAGPGGIAAGILPYIRPSTLLAARWRSRHFPLGDYRYETRAVENLRLVS